MSLFARIGILALLGGFAGMSQAAEPEHLRIIDTDTQFVVKHADGKQTVITREMTACAKNKGWIQPIIPVPGVHPVGEIEILNAMNDRDALLVDMREPMDRANGTIEGSVSIVYTEVANRLRMV